MQINIDSLKNKKFQIGVIVGCLVVALLLFFSDYGIVKRISLEMELTENQKEIVLQKQISDSLQIKINQLQFDTLEIERIAREKYGMTKPNEDVYYIKKKE